MAQQRCFLAGRSNKEHGYSSVSKGKVTSPLLMRAYTGIPRRNLMFVDPCIIVKFIQKNPTRCNSISKFIIPYLYEVQRVSGDTLPIIRSLKLL
jgi:hypothetical protein